MKRVGLALARPYILRFRPALRLPMPSRTTRSITLSGPDAAAFANAQRKQVFGALYRRQGEQLHRIDEEVVIAPEGFLAWAVENSAGAQLGWISTDPEMLTETDAWVARQNDGARESGDQVVSRTQGNRVQSASPFLAPAIGKLGFRLATMQQFTDPLRLDANYVRRSDAEVAWVDRQERASKTAG